MENNEDVLPAGNAGAASPGASDPGTPGGDTTPSNPGDPNGASPDKRDEEINVLKKNIQGLNKALIDSRRSSRQKTSPLDNPAGGDNPFDSEAGQYAAALELSDARLRGNMEERIALYPELAPEELQRIRLNPWAFASRQSFLQGDWETALDEIEEKIANRVEELAGNPPPTKGQSQPGAPAPATVNANPTPEVPAEDVEPGSNEDQDLWTMPLNKLERLKNKAVAKMSQPQQ
jgi:hypothetical protein